MNEVINDEYLGDGVYASFDGHNICLDLRGQDSTTWIALEPKVMVALLRYSDRVTKLMQSLPDLPQ